MSTLYLLLAAVGSVIALFISLVKSKEASDKARDEALSKNLVLEESKHAEESVKEATSRVIDFRKLYDEYVKGTGNSTEGDL